MNYDHHHSNNNNNNSKQAAVFLINIFPQFIPPIIIKCYGHRERKIKPKWWKKWIRLFVKKLVSETQREKIHKHRVMRTGETFLSCDKYMDLMLRMVTTTTTTITKRKSATRAFIPVNSLNEWKYHYYHWVFINIFSISNHSSLNNNNRFFDWNDIQSINSQSVFMTRERKKSGWINRWKLPNKNESKLKHWEKSEAICFLPLFLVQWIFISNHHHNGGKQQKSWNFKKMNPIRILNSQ